MLRLTAPTTADLPEGSDYRTGRPLVHQVGRSSVREEILRKYDVHASIPNQESLTIDVTAMSPEDAAGQIIEHIDAFGDSR